MLPGPACTAPARPKGRITGEGEDMLPVPASVQACRLILQGMEELGHHTSAATLDLPGLKTLALSITAMRSLDSNEDCLIFSWAENHNNSTRRRWTLLALLDLLHMDML